MKIDLAGGLEPRKGYTNVDMFECGDTGVRANCLYLPFADLSVDAVNASHYLEHLPKALVVPQLREVFRVLRYGGLLTLEVPDFAWVCGNWLLYRDNGWNMDAVFGDQSTPGQFHQTGFTENIMLSYLRAAGFCNGVKTQIFWSHNQNCLGFEVAK